jgi:hypothetical protein
VRRALRPAPSTSTPRTGALRLVGLEDRIAPANMLLPDLWVHPDRLKNWTYNNLGGGGREIRFDTAMANGGKGPFELNGTTTVVTDPDGTLRHLVNQKIFWDDGTTTSNPAGYFVYHPDHGHTHFDDFARAYLRTRPTANWQDGAIVATGPKTSFCLIDSWHYNPGLPGSPSSGTYGCSPTLQGISVGWADIYSQGLSGQSINITGLPNGDYWLEVEADTSNAILETNETNNTTRIAITIGGQPSVGFRVQSGTPTGAQYAPVPYAEVRFNQPVDPTTFTTADVVVTGPLGPVTVTGITNLDGANFRINFPAPLSAVGTYTITVGPNIASATGQLMDQNGNGVPGESGDFFYNIFTVPAPRVANVVPAGAVAPPIASVRVNYTKPMDSATFTVADINALTGPGGVNLVGEVSGIVPVTAGPTSAGFDITFKSALTAPGLYNLVLEPSVLDEYGNAIDQNGDGKSDALDRYNASFTIQQPGLVGPDSFGYSARSASLQNLEIAGTPGAVGLTFANTDDGTNTIPLGTNKLNFYGTTYTGSNQLYVSTNGLVTFGSGNTAYQNNDMKSITQAAIAVLWDDWVIGDVTPQVVYKFEDADSNGTPERLIIQWNKIEHYASSPSPVTFQVALELNTGAKPGTLLINYPDLDTGDGNANGVSASVGIKPVGTTTAPLLISQDGSNSIVAQGKAIQITVPTVASITRLDPNPAEAGDIEWLVTFSEPVTGVDVADFVLTSTGVSGAYIDHIHPEADPREFIVHARSGVGAGTVRLDLVDDDTIVSTLGAKLGGVGKFNGSFTAGEVYTVVQPAPQVQSAIVGDGTAQRSVVRELRVAFDYPVVFKGAASAAFVLTGPGGPVGVVVDTASLSNPFQTIAKLTFTGAGTLPGGSLADGDYTLSILGSEISTGGVALDGDGNGTPGGDYALAFHRLFGDVDGDRDVDAADFGAFRQAFGTANLAFDADGDGDVDASDFGAFRNNFGTSI